MLQKLGIDARPLAYGMTGNSRYLAEVLQILIPKYSHIDFYLFSHKPIHPMFSHLLRDNVKLVVEKRRTVGPIYFHFLLPKRIKENSIEVFWGTLQMLPLFKLHIPTIVNYHDLNFISAKETMEKWNYWQHRLLSPITIKQADTILCLSQNTRSEIGKYFPEHINKCLVVYPGVTKQKKVKKPSFLPKQFFLTVGTLEPRKNIQRLVEGFLDFQNKTKNNKFSLVIMGRKGWGKEGEELYRKLSSREYQDSGILFLENPEDSTLFAGFQNCHAFFFPSLHEGFGLPLLEAMAEGKRCAASNIPVFSEILSSKSDIFVPAQEITAWSKAFAKLSTNHTKRNPAFPIRKWTWTETAKKIEEVLFL